MNHRPNAHCIARSLAFALAFAIPLTLTLMAPAAQAAGKHAGGHDESAIGEPGKAANVTRTVQIDMSDAMRYTPSSVDAKQGDTIRFVIKNSGKVKHELVLGTQKELQEHYEQMKKFPEMEHDDPNMVTVAPGKTGEVIWKFSKAGKIDFACLQPGHYDAGMKGAVAVAAGKAAAKGTAMATRNTEWQRRRWLALPLWLVVPAAWGQPAGTVEWVDVWKSPTCGCCKDWVTHLESNGFKVRTHDDGNTAARQRLGVPLRLGSCHTASVGGYAIEGHVPAREIRRLLNDRPAATGLAVPAMPVGSPGMDGPAYGQRKDPYEVFLVAKDGSTTTYQRY